MPVIVRGGGMYLRNASAPHNFWLKWRGTKRIGRVKAKPLRGGLRPALTLRIPAVRKSMQPE